MGKVSKGAAFVFGMISIISLFLIVAVISIFKLADTNNLMVAAFLTAIVGMVTSYMGIDVANNAARGKYFNENVAKLDAEQRGE